MKEFDIPWGNWHSCDNFQLQFPENWDVKKATMDDALALKEGEIIQAFENPIGSDKLEDLAREKDSAVIVLDDISRPTPGSLLLPPVIERLESAGIGREDIKIIMALGAHRPMTRNDIRKKVGPEILGSVEILNHHPYENLVKLGTSRKGTPIELNKDYISAALKISISTILPHCAAGFGGGAKNILPGIAGINTIKANHKMVIKVTDKDGTVDSYLGNPENPLRKDIEEIANQTGLDFIINAVVNSKQEIAGIFVGDLVQAHREGVKFARKVYKTNSPRNPSLVICNAFPKDTELVQAGNALTVLNSASSSYLPKDTSVVITTAASEGVGFHSLSDPGMSLTIPFETRFNSKLGGNRWFLFSPKLTKRDLGKFYSEDETCNVFYNRWDELISDLNSLHNGEIRTVIFPQASMQLLSNTKSMDAT